MVFSRTAAAVIATIAAPFAGSAWAKEAGGGTRAAAASAESAPPACARLVAGQADAAPAPGSARPPGDGARIQLRIAVGKDAVAVNNEGGVVVVQPRSGMCLGGD